MPELARHFRFQWEEAQQCHVLLYPEGMIKLPGSAGKSSSASTARHVGGDRRESGGQVPASGLCDDVVEFLEVAHGNRWIRY